MILGAVRATNDITINDERERVHGDGVDRYKLRPALDRKTVGRDDRFVCGIVAHHRGMVGPIRWQPRCRFIGIAIIASENGY